MENRSLVARGLGRVGVAQIQRGGTEEFFCGDGTLLCLDCGGDCMYLRGIKLHRVTRTRTNERMQLRKDGEGLPWWSSG